jgi:hypothetical protein
MQHDELPTQTPVESTETAIVICKLFPVILNYKKACCMLTLLSRTVIEVGERVTTGHGSNMSAMNP